MKATTKKKREKLVYTTSSQVFHLWANQSQTYARQGGSLTRSSFQGESAYSYRAEIARIVSYRGVKVGIVSSHKYSNTTSKHQRDCIYALDGLMPAVSGSTWNVKACLLEMQAKLVDELMSLFSMRKFSSWYNPLDRGNHLTLSLHNFNETCKALKHSELCIEPDDDFKQLWAAHRIQCMSRQTELDATAEERRLKQQVIALAKNTEDIERWRRCEINATNFIRSLKPQILRVQGHTVQTSGGAEVEMMEALALLNKVTKGIAKQGDRVGSFTLDSVSQDFAKIGCHVISLEEARRVLKPGYLSLVSNQKEETCVQRKS